MKIELIPLIDACDLPNEVEDELTGHEISTHYQSDILSFDWNGDSYYPKLQKWLVETYGEEVKQYTSFGLQAT